MFDKKAFSRPISKVEMHDGTIEYFDSQDGLTRRELFAAMAMQGMLANGDFLVIDKTMGVDTLYAVKCADALIAELDKEVG